MKTATQTTRKSAVTVAHVADMADGGAICEIAVLPSKGKADVCQYAFTSIPCEFYGEVGFEVFKLAIDNVDPAHHIRLNARGHVDCDCKAGLLKKVACRHEIALRDMVAAGHLAGPRCK